MTMKKLIAMLLCLVMCISACFTLSSCSGEEEEETKTEEKVNKDKKVDIKDAVGLVIEDIVISVPETEDEYGYVTPAQTVKVDKIELYLGGEEGNYIGSGSGSMSTTVDGIDMTVGVEIIIIDGCVYLVANMSAKGSPIVSDMYMIMDLEEFLDFVSTDLVASLEDIEDYLNQGADMAPVVEAWVSEKLIPALGNLESLAPTEEELAAVEAYIITLAEKFIVTEEVANGTKITLDLDILKTWVADAKTQKASELIDTVLGEGTYKGIKDFTAGVLAFTVGDLVSAFEKNGGSVAALEAAINELLALAGAPEGTTLAALIAESFEGFEGTVAEFLALPEISALTVKDFMVAVGMAKTKDEAQKFIDNAFTTLETKTVFELSGATSENVEQIEAVLGMICDGYTYSVVVNDIGEIISLDYIVDIEDMGEASFKVVKSGANYSATINANVQGAAVSAKAKILTSTTGEYNKTKLDKATSVTAKAKKMLTDKDAVAEMILDEVRWRLDFDAAEPTLTKLYEDGVYVGVFIEGENNRYTVYFDDIFTFMVQEAMGMSSANVVFYGTSEYLNYDEDGNSFWENDGVTTFGVSFELVK